jgi:hypothetical protein
VFVPNYLPGFDVVMLRANAASTLYAVPDRKTAQKAMVHLHTNGLKSKMYFVRAVKARWIVQINH